MLIFNETQPYKIRLLIKSSPGSSQQNFASKLHVATLGICLFVSPASQHVSYIHVLRKIS